MHLNERIPHPLGLKPTSNVIVTRLKPGMVKALLAGFRLLTIVRFRMRVRWW